jgi:Rha family phage regulatory protein
MSNSIILSQDDGIVTADSREIADHFEKEHRHVLRDIDTLKEDVPNFGQMFLAGIYLDSYGREQRKYDMTRDGFSLLAMGFTGSKALSWKLAYIKAFNALEAKAKTPRSAAEQLLAQAQLMVDAERRLTALEDRVDRVAAVAQPIGADWQTEIESRVRFICKTYGHEYQEAHHQLYSTLESRVPCDLEARRRNYRARLLEQGATKTRVANISILSTIAACPDLRDPYELIVRDWAAYVETRA